MNADDQPDGAVAADSRVPEFLWKRLSSSPPAFAPWGQCYKTFFVRDLRIFVTS